MSMIKAIKHGKEHRKLYGGIMDYMSCRLHHGPCRWCIDDRVHQRKKKTEKAESKLSEEPLPADCIRSFNRKKKVYGL